MNRTIKIMKTVKKWLKVASIHIREVFFTLSHRNYIVHIGHFSKGKKMVGNVGDPILFRELEVLYDHINEENNIWLHRTIGLEITWFEVWLYNRFAKIVIVGGHGLLMVDTGKNDNSGWQFNIKLKNLRSLKCPIAFLAIGYNTFRGQPDFIPVFKSHINECVSRSVLFGLRNFGSINTLKPYLTDENFNKLVFQPCPTTMLALYERYEVIQPQNRIAICLAFDRFKNRFGDSFEEILDKIMKYVSVWKNKGYEVLFFIHNPADLRDEYCKELVNRYSLRCLSNMYPHEVFEFYRSQKLIVGMRGHSLMIPWGLQVPVISLTTQNKQKWFIETTGHPEYSIEVTTPNLTEVLNEKTQFVMDNYSVIIKDIIKKTE